MEVVESTQLRKLWGRHQAVRNFDLRVRPGEILALLGPNGAGKTTIIKMLSGLARPSGGRLRVLGEDPWRNWRALRQRVGVLIDAKFPPYLTALEQLQMSCRVGGFPPAEAGERLAMVGLQGAAHRRIGTFSFGMTQRLGLAQALLGQPEFVILDEPLVGLDPAGVLEIKGKLRSLAAAGTTIFFSSHQLKEVEELCTRVVFIQHGEVQMDGRAEDLHAVTAYAVQVGEVSRASEALSRAAVAFTVLDGNWLELRVTSGAPFAHALQAMVAAGVTVMHAEPVRRGLEHLFTGGERERVATSTS